MIDCRPSVLPVSIPLSALSPRTVADVRGISSCKPSQETGQSIMDMDTSEITISQIVGFQWDDPGTDVEDELAVPVLSPVQNVAPVIPRSETADFLDRGDGFDLDLAKVMLDVSVMPALISPIRGGIRGAAVVGGGRVCCTCEPSLGDRDRIAGIFGPRGTPASECGSGVGRNTGRRFRDI